MQARPWTHIGYAGTYPLQLPLSKQESASKKGSIDQDPKTSEPKPSTEHCSNTAANSTTEGKAKEGKARGQDRKPDPTSWT